MRRDTTGFLKLSEEAGLLASRVRFLGWNNNDEQVTVAIRCLDEAREQLFMASVEAAEKASELPLFDKPFDKAKAEEIRAENERIILRPKHSFEPGTKVFACNKCNDPRARDIAACPVCYSPEYRLGIINPDGTIGRDEEARAELLAPPKKRTKKAKADPVPPDDWEDPTGQVAAHQAEKDWRSESCSKLRIDYRLMDLLVTKYRNLGELADMLETSKLADERDEKNEPPIGFSAIGVEMRKKCREALDEFREESTPVESPPSESDPLDSPAMDELPQHDYDVFLPGDGDGHPRSFVGTVRAPNLIAARVEAARVEADRQHQEPFISPDTPLEVAPAKGFIEGMFTEIRECALCGRRWPAKESVGCPACIHDEPTAEPAKPRRFLVKSAKGAPLFALEAGSIEEAQAYLRDQPHPSGQTVEALDTGFPIKLPAWLKTKSINPPAKPKRARKRKEESVAAR